MTMNDLGNALGAAAENAKAEPLLRRALAIRERALGPEHPDTGSSLNSLAVLLRDKGDYAGVEPLLRRARRLRRRCLGRSIPLLPPA